LIEDYMKKLITTAFVLLALTCAFAQTIQEMGFGTSQDPGKAASDATADAMRKLYSSCHGTMSDARVYDMSCQESGGYTHCTAFVTGECH
jgi:hypothetical protein